MALEPLAKKGNFFHVYDFRVEPGTGDEFIDLFNEYDYSDDNPMHKSSAQVKDGVLCRDTEDPNHFYLIGEWRDIDVHREIREQMAAGRHGSAGFLALLEDPAFVPTYAEIVTETPQDILDKAEAARAD